MFYKWNLIINDKDDNKFTDCAIAGGADYIVSEDKHFDIIKGIEFPKLRLLSTDEFMDRLQSSAVS
ncbi:nucleotide-binding protein [Candidatus Magnetoovum chiemensis]|nr:nucleotide-binding protein [Candidatus Magnetoovum chiemensis]